MAINYASKYSPKVDERFTKESQSKLGCGGAIEFTGVKTVKIYSFPTVPLSNYDRTATSNRYGNPTELQDQVQEATVTQDKAFTYIIDRMNRDETEMTHEAGKALARELSEVVKPAIDKYTFGKQAEAARKAGGYIDVTVSTTNAYSSFLLGNEYLGDNNVPDAGRVAFCSYKFGNLLKQDTAFVKSAESSQDMLIKGVIGTVDGTKIVLVPKSRLPENVECIVVHPSATAQPMKLQDYKTHDNPPGISGWLVEGRIVYDAIIFDQKQTAIAIIQKNKAVGSITVASVAGTTTGKTAITLSGDYANAPINGKLCYKTGASAPAVTFDTAVSGFTDWNGADEITATTGHYITIAAVDADNKPIASGNVVVTSKA